MPPYVTLIACETLFVPGKNAPSSFYQIEVA